MVDLTLLQENFRDLEMFLYPSPGFHLLFKNIFTELFRVLFCLYGVDFGQNIDLSVQQHP